MLSKEDKIKQAKEAIIYVLSLLRKAAPGLDQSQLKIGRDRDLLGDRTNIYLYFQQCLKPDGTPTTIDNSGGRKAVYYKEVSALGDRIRQLNKDPQIKDWYGGTYSGLNHIPEGQPKSGDDSYYGITFTLTFADFKPGDIVKIKQQGLDPGEAAGVEYRVIDQMGNQVRVALADPNSSSKGNWMGPAYTLYLA